MNYHQIDTIGFDADDTLWHNETLYTMTAAKFRDLLSDYHEPEWIDQRLYETEVANLHSFGYGIKSFALSMIEAAIELTEGRISGYEVQKIIDAAKEMQASPVKLLPCVEETLKRLTNEYRLLLITKGDLFDQEVKLARSGLGKYFDRIEVVTEKDESTYNHVLMKHAISPERFLMVGNSVRSDVLPLKSLGAEAVHIPYVTTWAHEQVDRAQISTTFASLSSMCELIPFLGKNGYEVE